jgi:hypothetical protein
MRDTAATLLDASRAQSPHPQPQRVSDPATGAGNRFFCAWCDGWWTGLTACHCSACHRNFTSIGAFDSHRGGSHAHATRHCVDPASVGLVPADKPWPGWSRPGIWGGPT